MKKIERDAQARMQAQVEAKVNEVKAAEDDLKIMIKKLDRTIELLAQQTFNVQRSVSSSSGISSASNPDSGISPSSSSSRVEIEEKLSLSMMQMNLTRTTNISGVSTPDESILEPLEEEKEREP